MMTDNETVAAEDAPANNEYVVTVQATEMRAADAEGETKSSSLGHNRDRQERGRARIVRTDSCTAPGQRRNWYGIQRS